MSNILKHPEYFNPDFLFDGEKWADIDVFGKYEVSNKGRVRHQTNGVKKPVACKRKYLRLNLYLDKKPYNKRIHRLVATKFIPNPNNLPEVNHLDGDKSNNFDNNLEWCTHASNMEHAYKTGLIDLSFQYVPVRVFNTITGTGKEYKTISTAAADLGMKYSNLRRAFNRNRSNYLHYELTRL